jgi:hypothetical protein
VEIRKFSPTLFAKAGRYTFGQQEQLTDGHLDRMARSSRQLTGNLNSPDLQAESSDITLNSGTPIYSNFYIQVFLSMHRMKPIKLTRVKSQYAPKKILVDRHFSMVNLSQAMHVCVKAFSKGDKFY